MYVLSNTIVVCIEFNFFVIGDPHSDSNADGDPFKTLFVARIVSV